MRSSVCVLPEPGNPVMPILTGADKRRGIDDYLPVDGTDKARRIMKGSNDPSIVLHLRTDSAGVDARVYPVREDSLLLARHADAAAKEDVLEIGCGLGLAALTAAKTAKRVVATDLNPYALAAVQRLAVREKRRLDPVRTDLAAGLGRFDLILCNPPYLPTRPGEEDKDRWTDLALNGGVDGCAALERIVGALPEHLSPGGRAYVVLSSLQDPEHVKSILHRFIATGGSVRPVDYEDFSTEFLTLLEFHSSPSEGNPGRFTPAGSEGQRPRSA